MGIHVRLRHALGEKLLELPDPPPNTPLIVGRSRDAAIKIPSVTVIAKHCALFVNKGRWVIQDLSGGSATLNGNVIAKPMRLNIGDVIAVGTDSPPATIEIDPTGAAEGRAGQPAEAGEPAPASDESAPASAKMRMPSAPRLTAPTATPSAPRQAAPAVRPRSTAPAFVAGDSETTSPFIQDQLPPPNPAPADCASAPLRRRKKSNPVVGLTVGIVICIAIVVATGVTVYRIQQKKQVESVVTAPPKPVRHSNNIFDTDIGGPAPTASKESPTPCASAAPAPAVPRSSPAVVQPKAVDSPNPPAAQDAGPPADPRKDEKGWSEVEGATISPDIGMAILKFDDYRKQHPGAFTKELDAYTDDAMDRLWWKRITMLCTKRDAITKDIRAKEKDVRDEPTEAFKKTLQGEKKIKEDELAKVQEKLASEMGYTSVDPPDVDNKDAMTKLAAERDASKFGAWRVRTIKYIRINHGATPWDGE